MFKYTYMLNRIPFVELKPFFDYNVTDMILKKGVLMALGVKTEQDKKEKYCSMCKSFYPNADCANCSYKGG